MDFRTKLAFALVAACLLSMGALGYFTYLWAEELFLEDSRRQLEAVAERRETELRDVLGSWRQEALGIVTGTRSPEPPDAAALDSIVRFLEGVDAASEAIRRVALFDARGERLFGPDAGEAPPPADAPDGELTFIGLRPEPDRSPGLAFRTPVPLGEERPGWLEIVFGSEALVDVVGPAADVGATGRAFVALGDGGDAILVLGERRDGPERRIATVTRGRDREVVAATRLLPDSGLGIRVEVDGAEVRQRADRLRANMRDLAVSLAAFAILGGTLFGFYLARPIQTLVEQVDRIRHGELGLRLEVNGEDEVAFLAQSLNEFMDQLDRSSDLFRLGDLSVLVVQAEEESRLVLRDLLQNWNMRPTLTDSGASASRAVEKAGAEGRPFQLVLLSDPLPDVPAIEWALDLRASAWDGPIILLASSPEELDADELEKAGIRQVLPRPVVASHLMEAILEQMGVSAEGLASTTDTYLKKVAPRRILLVEDSRLIQRVMIHFLENWGHDVTLAENGRRAVEIMQEERFDLVFMDLEMPEMNGLDATVAIRAAEERNGRERTPIVALTAEALSADRDRCLAVGMDDYVAKPADPKILYAIVARCPARAPGSG